MCTRSIAIHACVHARHAYLERADLEFERALVQHVGRCGIPPLRLKSAMHDGRDGDGDGDDRDDGRDGGGNGRDGDGDCACRMMVKWW